MHKILILDANQRSALAATRSLGKKGIPVVVADSTPETLSGSSRYCRERFTCPSPFRYPERFVENLREEVEKRGIRVIFPMSEVTTHLVLNHRGQLGGAVVPYAPFETFDRLTDKWRLMELAGRLGIPIPATRFIQTAEQLFQSFPVLNFPVVLKPYRSRIFSQGCWISTSVHYADSAKEIKELVARHDYFREHPFLIQEYVQGHGQGIFTLYDSGTPVAFFAHRRLREKPPSGGVSVLCESIPVDERLRGFSRTLLDDMKWHGVAMVEFKVAADGTPYLMEVNARFWGSLQLAVDAGVDFPGLLYRMAVGERTEPVTGYKTGMKNRWLLGDLDYLYLVMKDRSPSGDRFRSKWRSALHALNIFQRHTRFEVNRWDDLGPFVFELKEYLRGSS